MTDFIMRGSMKITVYLNESEAKALAQLAKNEIRDPRSEVYLLIRNELLRQKLIEPNETPILQGNQEASYGNSDK
jgi:hypothetical protein